MSHAEFFPYPTAPGAATLECLPSHPDADVDGDRVLLQGVGEDDTVELHLVASLADEVYDSVLPESEHRDPPVELLVTVRGLQSRVRDAIRLVRDPSGSWKGRLELAKRDLYRVVRLEPVLVRTKRGNDAHYATHPGARLAWGTPVTIELDESPVAGGNYLDVRWDNFPHSDNPHRKSNPDLLYMLDTEPETPMLWLNSAVEHFKPVMHASGPRGRNLRIRDAMFDTIVSQVWTSLLSIVLTKLAAETAEEEEDTEAVLEAVNDWEMRVIHHWAPLLFPEASDRGEAISDLVFHAGDAELRAMLQERIGIAVQRQARTGHAFRGLIRLRDSEGV